MCIHYERVPTIELMITSLTSYIYLLFSSGENTFRSTLSKFQLCTHVRNCHSCHRNSGTSGRGLSPTVCALSPSSPFSPHLPALAATALLSVSASLTLLGSTFRVVPRSICLSVSGLSHRTASPGLPVLPRTAGFPPLLGPSDVPSGGIFSHPGGCLSFPY